MQEIKEDLRTKRTKTFLSSTLLKLMGEKPIEKISVADICEKAQVHRTTFYKHFEDKYHLLAYTFEGIKENLFIELEQGANNKDIKTLSTEINKIVIDFLLKRQTEILKILEHNQDEKFYTILRASITRSLKPLFIELKNEQKISSEIPAHILSTFIVGGMTNVILTHLKNPDNCKIDELITYVDKIIKNLVV